MDDNRCPSCGNSFISFRNNTKGLVVWKVFNEQISYFFESKIDALVFVNSHTSQPSLELYPIPIIPNMKITLLKEQKNG